jgi:hypothetical protein
LQGPPKFKAGVTSTTTQRSVTVLLQLGMLEMKNNCGKVYSVEYADTEKAVFMYHINHCCTNAMQGHCYTTC